MLPGRASTRTTRRSAESQTPTSTPSSTEPTGTTTTATSRDRPAVQRSAEASSATRSILDVKVTEDNSFPLASLIPLFPDIKRKAAVELSRGERNQGCSRSRCARRNPSVQWRCSTTKSSEHDPQGGEVLVKSNRLPTSQGCPDFPQVSKAGRPRILPIRTRKDGPPSRSRGVSTGMVVCDRLPRRMQHVGSDAPGPSGPPAGSVFIEPQAEGASRMASALRGTVTFTSLVDKCKICNQGGAVQVGELLLHDGNQITLTVANDDTVQSGLTLHPRLLVSERREPGRPRRSSIAPTSLRVAACTGYGTWILWGCSQSSSQARPTSASIDVGVMRGPKKKKKKKGGKGRVLRSDPGGRRPHRRRAPPPTSRLSTHSSTGTGNGNGNADCEFGLYM